MMIDDNDYISFTSSYNPSPAVANANVHGTNPPWAASTANQSLSITIKVPIQGWSSTARYADYTLNQHESCSYFTTSTAAIADSATVFNFASKIFDKANNVTTGAGWRFEPKSSGIFDVLVEIDINSATTASRFDIILRKNGTIYRQTFNTSTAQMVQTALLSTPIELVSGDYIDVQVKESGGLNGVFIGKQVISINKRATSQQLFAPIGPVVVNATNSSGQSIPTSVFTTITGWSKSQDTHGAFNASTGIFTAPEDGFYFTNSFTTFENQLWADGSSIESNIVPTTGSYGINVSMVSVTNQYWVCVKNSHLLWLKKGETIRLNIWQGSGGARTLATSGSRNTIQIFKVN